MRLRRELALSLSVALTLAALSFAPEIYAAAKSAKSKTASKACVKTIGKCPKKGCPGRGDSALSELKNREDTPAVGDVEKSTIPKVVGLKSPSKRDLKADRSALKGIEGKAVSVTGFLVHSKASGAEACNCFLPGSPNNDFHLTLSPINGEYDAVKKKSLVLEMSPRQRPQGWTTAKLSALSRRKTFVRVTGWLLYDSEHAGAVASLPRATAWEIHPVRKFEVCTKSTLCGDSDSAWKLLEDLP